MVFIGTVRDCAHYANFTSEEHVKYKSYPVYRHILAFQKEYALYKTLPLSVESVHTEMSLVTSQIEELEDSIEKLTVPSVSVDPPLPLPTIKSEKKRQRT